MEQKLLIAKKLVERYNTDKKFKEETLNSSTKFREYNNAKDFDHREYEVIQENILFKDLDIEPDCIDGEYIERNNYYWRKNNNLILYKALYNDCPDGPYFVRHAEDFYDNFTKIY